MDVQKQAGDGKEMGSRNTRQETAQKSTQEEKIRSQDIRINRVPKLPRHIQKQNRKRFIELLF
jgi:hypothetical protein